MVRMVARSNRWPLLLALAGVLLGTSARAQEGVWSSVDLGLGQDLHDVDFADAEHGCVVGVAATIRCTEAGGETAAEWFAGDVGAANQDLLGVHLRDALHGWAVGSGGTVLATADGGHTWTPLPVPAGPPSLTAVWTLDASQAWATSGTMGRVALRTTDGGSTWTQNAIVDGVGRRVVMADAAEGWLASTGSASGRGVIWRTTNGGVNWVEELTVGDLLHGLARSGSGRVWAVGEGGALYRRVGAWGAKESVGAVTLQGVAFAAEDEDHAWVVGLGGAIQASLDGGGAWGPQASGTSQDLLSVEAQAPLRAWAVDRAGTLLVFRQCSTDAHCAGGPAGCVDLGRCDLTQGTCGLPLADGAECGARSCQGLELYRETCLAGICQGVELLASCASADPCLDPTCDPAVGCGLAPNTASCDDGDACSVGDTCAAGACQPGAPRVCQDGDPCTDDGCDPGLGCVFTPNTAPCDDGDACSVGDRCAAGACQPGLPRDCSGLEGACVVGVCEPTTGACQVEPRPDGTGCEDGDPCTQGDRCQAGACAPGGAADCSHLDAGCRVGVCLADQGGCVARPRPDGTGCDDGQACTRGDACAGGDCIGEPYVCDDGDPCSLDRCDGAGGCAAPEPAPDGLACGECLACQAGRCVGAAQGSACEDEGGCAGQCDPDRECVVEAVCGEPVAGCGLVLEYGVEPGQSPVCRLPADSLETSIAVGVGPQAVTGLVPVRVRLARGADATPGRLWLELALGEDGAALVRGSLRARLLPASLETTVEVLPQAQAGGVLISLDGRADPWDVLELDLVMEARVPGGSPFAVRAWAPCVALPAEPGCHPGNAPGWEDRPPVSGPAGEVPGLQQAALAVEAWTLAGSYTAGGAGEDDPRSLGCACGGGPDGTLAAALGAFGLTAWARRGRRRR